MKAKTTRIPVSARISTSHKEILENAANENDLSLGELIENILADYVDFLGAKPASRRPGKD